jgi:hypothetical protein
LPDRFAWPDRCASLPRFELPFTDIEHDAAAQYRAMRDGVRSVNGTTGFIPPHMLILAAMLDARETEALGAVAENGPICIALDRSATAGKRLAGWLPNGPLVEPLAVASERSFFVLSAGPDFAGREGDPAVARGRRSDETLRLEGATSNAAAVDLRSITDGRPETGWLASSAQQRDEQLTLSIACSARVVEVTLMQGGYAPSYPRLLTIEAIQDDGRANTVWTGAPGVAFLRAAFRQPKEVSASFPVEMSHVRHIRLISTGRARDVGWGMADVRVHGRCQARATS